MRLIKYEGFNLTIEPEALLLEPFKKIWIRDKSKTKNRALQELGYIYFMDDPRSDYQFIIEEEERKKEIIKGEGLPSDWKPDKIVEEGRNYYKQFKPTAYLLLEDTRAMIDGYRMKLRNLTERMEDLDVKELKDIGTIIKQIPSLVKDLDEAEKTIIKEVTQSDKIRGAQTKSMYEDM